MKRREMKALKRRAVISRRPVSRRFRTVKVARAMVARAEARVRLSDWDLREGTFSLGCALRRASGVYARDVQFLREARRQLQEVLDLPPGAAGI